jgi:cell division protein FtsI (penicillin-binding protein 3)
VIGILIVVQIVKIQYKEGDYWRSVSDSLTTRYITIEPIRGNIYSADEKLLVTSIPIYDVRIDFKTSLWQDEVYFQGNIDLLALKMSNLFQDDGPYSYKQRIEKARNAQARYYLLKRNINHNQLQTLKTFPFFNQGRFKGGFITEQKSIRIYPFKLLAERTIGYKSKDPRVSPVGLEGAFDEHLSGKSGKRLMQKISGGN